jgi:adenine/guanine phosphoribosyltransferase-like PRPP-binding protein
MKPKYILIEDGELITYPVGQHIIENLPIIKKMVKTFKLVPVNKDKQVNLICIGSSGAIIATIFANELKGYKVKITHVKKDGEDSHDSHLLFNTDYDNIIVDDFTVTGKTMEIIYAKCKNAYNFTHIHCICITGQARTLNFDTNYFVCDRI